ncbi:hypothetical protein L7F22_024731 [Adiantum nelumboides]|nr:hypothetical protein [Adiantum nelumboides]
MAALLDRSISQPYRSGRSALRLHLCELPSPPAPAVVDRPSPIPDQPSSPVLPSPAAGAGTATPDFWQKLWTDPKSEELKAQALSTLFVSGVGLGTLDPRIFGKYTVQDAVYCAKIAHLWFNLSNNSNADEYLQDLARVLSRKYRDIATEMLQWWQIQSDESNEHFGVWLGDHATEYVKMVEGSLEKNPAYMLVPTFACLKLWPFLASTLEPKQPSNNIYAFWIEEHKQEGSSIKLVQKAINLYAEKLDYATALQLFHKGLQCEINFFTKP